MEREAAKTTPAPPVAEGTVLTCGVAMTTFNGARYVEEQLLSIAGQTRRAIQVVVSDDCSTDDTRQIVRRVGPETAPDFVLLDATERLGPVRNFERALRAMDTDIAFLCDQDDVWNTAKVSAVMSRFEADPDVGGVFTEGTIVSDDPALDDRSLWALAGFSPREQDRWAADPLGVLLRRNVVTGATLALRTSLLSRFLPLPGDGWHDLSLAVLLVAISKVEALPVPLIGYRIHESNTAGLPSGTRRSRVVDRATQLQNLDHQADHWTDLRDRLAKLGTDTAVLARVEAKIEHLRTRRGLPASRHARVRPVVREALSGGYRSYANGHWSVVRDVIGP